MLAVRPPAPRAFFLVDKDGVIHGRWLDTITDVFQTGPILEATQHDRGQ